MSSGRSRKGGASGAPPPIPGQAHGVVAAPPHKSWKPTSVYDVTLAEAFTTVRGGVIPRVTVRVEDHGVNTLPADRTVVVLPSFSHSSHVASHADDPSPGWWEDIVGPSKAIDTRHWRVMCVSLLGSPFSATNPAALHPTTGKPWRTAFPQVTPTDLARVHHAVLSQLGVSGRLHAVVGSSLGGMQALQYASLFPDRLSRLVSIASTGRTTPFTVGVRHTQRRAILQDPHYHHGNYDDHGTIPASGLKLARQVGTLFYRSRQEFDSRFRWEAFGDRHFTSLDTWEVENYLTYQGAKFANAYDANAYLLLSKCMDLMDLGDGWDGRMTYAEGAGRIRADTLLIGVQQDILIPPTELQSLAEVITRARASTSSVEGGGPGVRYVSIDSPYGHDAFLKEPQVLSALIRAHLEAGLEQELEVERVHNTGVNAP